MLAPMLHRAGRSQRLLTTVLFTDIVGSTERAAELGDRGWKALVARHHAIVRRALARFGGRELDTAGDGFFATFERPAQAIECATEIIDHLRPLDLRIRAAIHMGEAEVMGDKVGGITVHVASRALAEARPDEILVTSTVREVAAGADVTFSDRGVHVFKGVPEDWHLYAVEWRRRQLPLGGVETVPEVAGGRRLGWRAIAQPTSAIGIAPVTGSVVSVVTGITSPTGIAIADDTAWVLRLGGKLLIAIPLAGGTPRTIGLPGTPTGIAAGGGSAWVTFGYGATGASEGVVLRVSAMTQLEEQKIPFGNGASAIALDDSGVWVVNGVADTLTKIDPTTRSIVSTAEVAKQPAAVALGEGSVWVAHAVSRTIWRIDPATLTKTAEISLRAAEHLRRSIIEYYRKCLRLMMGVISFPTPRAAIERSVRRDLELSMRRFPATREFQKLDQPNEYYRRKIRIMMWRLERTAAGQGGAYTDAREFEEDARTLETLLSGHPSPRVARLCPRRLRVAVQVFGFHAASLDFRQHASLIRAASEEILRAHRKPAGPAKARIESIRSLLVRAPRKMRLSTGAKRTLAEFGALKDIQARFGEAASHRYILSMTRSAADVWDVLLLGWQAGLLRGRRGKLQTSFDVTPLFETLEDLEAGPGVLEELLSDSVYRRLVGSRGDFQEAMLGYSDSVKDGGYFAANFALLRAQKKLWEVAARHHVRLSLFHGKGGTIGRGGGQSHRSVHAQPYAAPGGRIRITEQGEVISLKYANLEIAERNLEQLVSSVLDTLLLDPRRKPREHRLPEWEAYAQEMADASSRFYRELVYETPGFMDYFRQATPIDLIEGLRLGSRPSRRSRAGDLSELRAIPWVFAWTQSRHFIPAWYGLGYALELFAGGHPPSGWQLLKEMYREWPFFALLIDNAEVSLAKTDLYIARRYDALCRDAALREAIFHRIEEEYQRSVRAVLAITESSRLLERQPVLEESIRLRNPYVDPLNFLQIRFLDEWRRAPAQRPELLHLLQLTVGGIAFGMKSTG